MPRIQCLTGPTKTRIGGRTARDYEFKVLTEDVWMLEQLPSTSLPLDLPAQAHTRADRITVEMRRLLAALLFLHDPHVPARGCRTHRRRARR